MKATTGLLACQRYLNNLSHTVWIEVIVYEHNSYILYNMFTHHAGKRAADRRWSTDHTFSTATHQESRLKQVQHLHAFAANLLTHTKPAVSKPWKTLYLWSRGIAASTTHLHLPSSTTYNHLSFTINNKYLQLVQNNLLPHSFSCFHLNAHSHQLHRCSPRPSRPLHSAAWNGSVERQRGKRVERQCGTAAWNGSVECAKLLRSSFWHTPRCRSMLQNAAGSDLSTGSVERPRGVRQWRTPRCRSMLQNAAGSDLSTGSVERPRGVRQAAAQQLLAHSTLPFHAAECSGVWPQHWQRGTAAWSAPAVPRCRMQRGLTSAPQAMEAPPAADVHGRALLQEKFDDRRVVGPCCRKSHQRWTNWCVRLTRPLSWNYAAVSKSQHLGRSMGHTSVKLG